MIPLKFTTADGQELPLADYAAVPRELLRKLEEIAIRARQLIAVHKAAILGGTSNMVEKAMSDLTKDFSALETTSFDSLRGFRQGRSGAFENMQSLPGLAKAGRKPG